jgi:hypothetical protein
LPDDILPPMNRTAAPESTLSVAQYGTDFWLAWSKEKCQPFWSFQRIFN